MKANENTQQARTMLSGGFADFLIYLTNMPDPIIIGNGYPHDRLMKVFYTWAKTCDFDTTGADVNLWRAACQHGFFKET